MSDQSFTVLVFMSALITALVVKPARRLVFYKRRTLAWPQPAAEFHVLAPRDVPALLTLLDVASPSERPPVAVQALHLIEIAGRSSAPLLINVSAPSSSFKHSATAHRRSQVELQFKHIAHAFMAYEVNVAGVAARTTAAEEQHSALILLQFHKHRSVDGALEVFHPAIQPLNQSIQRSSMTLATASPVRREWEKRSAREPDAMDLIVEMMRASRERVEHWADCKRDRVVLALKVFDKMCVAWVERGNGEGEVKGSWDISHALLTRIRAGTRSWRDM